MFRKLGGGSATVALAVAVFAASALAATNLAQKGGVDGCVTEDGLGGQCQNGRGVVGPAAIALSPDGTHAYVAASRQNSVNGVAVLSRDPNGGALRPIDDPASCHVELEEGNYPSCASGRALLGAEGIAVSPDGENVYVASREADAVAVFDRDPETGLLSQSSEDDGCVAVSLSGCATGRALDGPHNVAVSPNGEQVYVASMDAGGGVSVFQRDGDGDLSQLAGEDGCINWEGVEGCAEAFGVLTRPQDVEIDPGGTFAYVASRPGDAIYVFSRDSSSGELTAVPPPAGCVNETGIDGCGEAKALGNPVALAFDPSGQTLYAAAERAHAIVVFDRNQQTGGLTEKAGTAGCVSSTGRSIPGQANTEGQCQDGIALYEVDELAVAPDGAALYASTRDSDGVAILERRADGALTQRPGQFGCITETGYERPNIPSAAGLCTDGRALAGASGIAVGPDSLQVYAAARDGGVTSFDVVPPPEPPPQVEEPQPLVVAPPPPPDRSACRAVIRKRRAIGRSLGRALRRQGRLRRQLRHGAPSPGMVTALKRAHRRVKKLRRKRHLATHRERRLCK